MLCDMLAQTAGWTLVGWNFVHIIRGRRQLRRFVVVPLRYYPVTITTSFRSDSSLESHRQPTAVTTRHQQGTQQ